MFQTLAQNLLPLLLIITFILLISTVIFIIYQRRHFSIMGTILEEFIEINDWFNEIKFAGRYGYYDTETLIESVKVALRFYHHKETRRNQYSITIDFREWATDTKLSLGEYKFYLKKLDHEIESIRIERYSNKNSGTIEPLIKSDTSRLSQMQGIIRFSDFNSDELVKLMKILINTTDSFREETTMMLDTSKLIFSEDADFVVVQSTTADPT